MESAPSPTSPVATVAATMSLLSPDTPGPRIVKTQHPKESPWSLVLQVNITWGQNCRAKTRDTM